MRSVVADVGAAEAAETVTCWMKVTPRIFFITVVHGTNTTSS